MSSSSSAAGVERRRRRRPYRRGRARFLGLGGRVKDAPAGIASASLHPPISLSPADSLPRGGLSTRTPGSSRAHGVRDSALSLYRDSRCSSARARARSPDVAVAVERVPRVSRPSPTAHQMSPARSGVFDGAVRRCVSHLRHDGPPRERPKSPNGSLGFEQQLRDVH